MKKKRICFENNDEYERFAQNMGVFYDHQEDEQFIMAHEAGHMVLLRKFFPSNVFSYGWHDEHNVPCVNDDNDYDYGQFSVCKHHIMVALAGYVASCKMLGMSHREVQLVMEYLTADENEREGSDLWKAQQFLRLTNQQYGVKLRMTKLVGETYDAMDGEAIQSEMEYQEDMKKTA